MVVILVVAFLPVIPMTSSSSGSCSAEGCTQASNYGSIAYAFLGVGGVYDPSGSYYVGPFWTPSPSRGWTYSSPIASNGLQLMMTLNATKTSAQGGIAVQVYVLNTNRMNVSLFSPQNVNISYWNEFEPNCPSALATNLVSFALFRGHYGPANVSEAGRPLSLAAPLFIECPSAPFPNKVVFLPSSAYAAGFFHSNRAEPYLQNGTVFSVAANVTTEECGPSPSGFTCGDGVSLTGYWNASGASFLQPDIRMLKYFEHFQPGEYTIAAEDAWNQTLYAVLEVD
jgi:hypothetical protein